MFCHVIKPRGYIDITFSISPFGYYVAKPKTPKNLYIDSNFPPNPKRKKDSIVKDLKLESEAINLLIPETIKAQSKHIKPV